MRVSFVVICLAVIVAGLSFAGSAAAQRRHPINPTPFSHEPCSVLDGRPRSATVVAVGPLRAFELGAEALATTALVHPASALALARLAGARLRAADELAEHLMAELRRRGGPAPGEEPPA